jgi:hypothetical protein
MATQLGVKSQKRRFLFVWLTSHLFQGDASSSAQLESINRGLHVVIWSFTGYDSLGNILLALSPPTDFPKAVVGAIVLSFLTYATAVIGLLGAPSLYSSAPNFEG